MSMMDAFAVQNMWTSVLVQVARDLTRGQSSEAAMAERWIGTYPTSDFCEVCARAGLEPTRSHAWFRKLCDTPFEERKTRTHGLDITVSDAAARPLGHAIPCRPNGRIAGRTKSQTQEQPA